MNGVLESIYCGLLEEPLSESKLETLKMKRKLDTFCNTYFEKSSLEKFNGAYYELADLLNTYQKQAFSTGFNTAVELLTGRK